MNRVIAPRLSAGVLIGALIILSTAAFSLARPPRADDDIGFPHAKHAKLFPTCAGCHAGITTRDSATLFPAAQACAECHNDRDVKVVSWSAPRRRPVNLRFDHARHATITDASGARVGCARCHGDGPSSTTMQVVRPSPETCIGCHPHEAPSHFAPSAPCATCHVPLARATMLTDSAIAALPKPSSHSAADFITAHGALATSQAQTCATCHARESCARCHLNAASLPAIRALGESPRIAQLVRGKPPAYPVPASHARRDFVSAHGSLARANVQSCATCHAQAGCRACHTGTMGASTINALPAGDRGVQLHPPPARPPAPWPGLGAAAGIAVAVDSPPSRGDTATKRVVRVHAADFARTHGPVAATGRLDCAGCHVQSFCSACHQGSGQRRFHPFNFVSRHASESYARETKCASCHNTEVFCRSCHRDAAGIGAGSKRRAGTAHAGQPLWLLQHSEAARRDMTACTTCHQQIDCLQCHSAYGSRINPHGAGFNAEAMRKRNPTLCSYCHLSVPR